MKNRPLVSVVMATRNRASLLKESVESILSQSYKNLELLIVDDASSDETSHILKEYAVRDARIRLLSNQTNLGLTKSLNKALREAKGKYIARVDDKAIAHKERIQLQVEFLEANPSCALLGTWAYEMDKEGTIANKKKLPTDSAALKRALIFTNPFVHSAIMMRKEALDKVGWYDERWKYTQDYELYFRIAKFYDTANLSAYLTTYRFAPDSITRTRNREQALFALKARQKALREGFYPKSLRASLGIARGYVSYLVPASLRRGIKGMGYQLRGARSHKEQDRMFKICQVASADISLRFLLLDFMRYLQKEKYEVHAASSDGKWVPEIRNTGIKVQTTMITRRLFTPIADLAALFRLYWFFKKERFDIVHTHTPKASFLGQLAAFFARVPVRITTIHGLYFQKDSSWQKKFIFIPIERIIAKIVHKAFSVNKEDVAFLTGHGIYPSGKVIYVGGGINLRKFDPSRFSKEFIAQKKREIGVPLNTKVVGIVARLVREKGFIPLFAAFVQILKRFPNTVLLIIGPEEPEKRDALDKNIVDTYGIRDKVLFLGERIDVIELYSVMDVFVLPSYREGLGLSILEASAMKRPVVASDIRGCREGVDDKKTGFLVPSSNPAKLAEAIEHILSHPEEAKVMGEEGRKKVEREYDQDAVFELLRKEYEQLLKAKLRISSLGQNP
ncbi:MAG: glycosyltransferase [Parcubacteria group bacterium]|nr:glycosyltransferase [Parcubacteria group bacterium]